MTEPETTEPTMTMQGILEMRIHILAGETPPHEQLRAAVKFLRNARINAKAKTAPKRKKKEPVDLTKLLGEIG